MAAFQEKPSDDNGRAQARIDAEFWRVTSEPSTQAWAYSMAGEHYEAMRRFEEDNARPAKPGLHPATFSNRSILFIFGSLFSVTFLSLFLSPPIAFVLVFFAATPVWWLCIGRHYEWDSSQNLCFLGSYTAVALLTLIFG